MSIKQGLECEKCRQKVPLHVSPQILMPKGPLPSSPHLSSSLAQGDPALDTWEGVNDNIPDTFGPVSYKQTILRHRSGPPEMVTTQVYDQKTIALRAGIRAHGRKAQRYLTVFKKAVRRRSALETFAISDVPSSSETEKDNCSEPFKRAFWILCTMYKAEAAEHTVARCCWERRRSQ